MKNKRILIVGVPTLFVVGLSFVVLTMVSYNNKNKLNTSEELKNSVENISNIEKFAIYKETTPDNFELVLENDFPTQGYLLNESKTECFGYGSNRKVENAINQSLTKGVIDGGVILSANQSIYCNVYFSKDSTPPTINTFTLEGSKANDNLTLTDGYTHIKNITYTINWQDIDVAQICVKENDICTNNEWEQITGTSKNGSLILSDLDGVKIVRAYLKDKANNVSEAFINNIVLDSIDPTITLSQKTVTDSSITVSVVVNDTNEISNVICKAVEGSETKIGVYDISTKTCTFSGLKNNTQYTLTGEATDVSGRKGISIPISITTKIGYTCDNIGGTLSYNQQKGWICQNNGKSSIVTRWTCSVNTLIKYDTEESAKAACVNETKGTCAETQHFGCPWGGTLEGSVCRQYQSCDEGRNGDWVVWSCPVGGQMYYYEAQCRNGCFSSYSPTVTSIFTCSINGMEYSTQNDCISACVKTEGLGKVESYNETIYSCDSGWKELSGSGTNLICYKEASKS